jgi:hypothetical protein
MMWSPPLKGRSYRLTLHSFNTLSALHLHLTWLSAQVESGSCSCLYSLDLVHYLEQVPDEHLLTRADLTPVRIRKKFCVGKF